MKMKKLKQISNKIIQKMRMILMKIKSYRNHKKILKNNWGRNKKRK